MFSRPKPEDPREIVMGRVAIAVAEMLARDFDEICLEYLGADTHPHDPRQKTAEVANRIVILCRRLVEEIQRYERYAWLRQEAEEEEEETRIF
jgi:hypothetical protein